MKTFAILLCTLCACSTPAILTPLKGAGTEYPCGYDKILLNGYCVPFDMMVPDGMSGVPLKIPAKPEVYKL